MTKQNAANAEESASASEELSAQAASMQEVVAQLVAVVGGKTLRTGGSASKQMAQSPKVTLPAEQATGKPHGFGRSDEPFHKIARGDAKAELKATAASAAHKAIPLDPREDDLKDFNG